MNNEIKEIWKLTFDGDADIEYFTNNGGKTYTTWDCSEVLDYITNLQEENIKLKHLISLLKEDVRTGKEIIWELESKEK